MISPFYHKQPNPKQISKFSCRKPHQNKLSPSCFFPSTYVLYQC
ncbi:hypothetical protein F383_33776 [Gossypium arboreum]|uniref:Uncharacterized protein n=1 Tax=Gossypium arboreum TaxID=29729 RepID=A0A0B0N4E2_GOSAR|nr:hypothetical protein F383_33776 [Gossypium arboreum]